MITHPRSHRYRRADSPYPIPQVVAHRWRQTVCKGLVCSEVDTASEAAEIVLMMAVWPLPAQTTTKRVEPFQGFDPHRRVVDSSWLQETHEKSTGCASGTRRLTHPLASGAVCWLLDDAQALDEPVSMSGRQGIWEAMF